jgi:hypothetical protein
LFITSDLLWNEVYHRKTRKAIMEPTVTIRLVVLSGGDWVDVLERKVSTGVRESTWWRKSVAVQTRGEY